MAFIFRAMPTNELDPEQAEALFQSVVEVEGPPSEHLGIRFTSPQARAGVTPAEIDDSGGRDPDWRDKPRSERTRIYWSEGAQEAKRESRAIWVSFKNDPLDPVRGYFEQYVMTGMGLFLEGWVIFSISNVSTLFKQTYKHCWGTSKPIHCNNTWLQATTYLQLIGILLGQLTFGFMGDWIGRKASMLIDMSVVLLGVIMLTVSNGTTQQGWVVMYGISQLVFGIGIGGEYPATSTRATEESQESRVLNQRHRGRKVMLSYTMQGWGQFLNLSTLIILLLIFNSHGSPPYSNAAAGLTWRLSFAVLIPLVLYLIYYRIYVLKELKALDREKKRNNVQGYDWKGFRLLFTCFWHRLVGSAGIWFCNDWYFYGNGVFRSTFVGIIAGSNASVTTNWLWSLLNAGVQLFGYYFAALSVDFRPWGRRRMTVFSFLMIFAIFMICYIAYPQLVMKTHIHWFQFLYYFSSFWGLFGSHTTSFLISAEIYPTSVRSTAHGISAASGKVGSIIVTVWFNYVSTRIKFLITFPVAMLGAILCYVFVPDLTGLDLAEQDLRWHFIRAGKGHDYHGPAVHPRHLSLWEKAVLKLHLQYDPELHKQQTELIKESFVAKTQGPADSSPALLQKKLDEKPEPLDKAAIIGGSI